jgi:MscS family membrane protein
VGDVIKAGDTVGTVDDIGLRSTKIRTPDRTVVTVPNGHIANMTLESLSSRDKFWFHPILALRYGTTSPQMCAVLEGLRSLLRESRNLETASARVRFLRFGPSSFDVEIFAYVLARDWSQFLEVQENLLLRIIDCVESSGVQFAFPPQTMLVRASISEAPERVLLNVATGDEKLSDKMTVAKSA